MRAQTDLVPVRCLPGHLSSNQAQDSANKRTLFIEQAAIGPAQAKLMA